MPPLPCPGAPGRPLSAERPAPGCRVEQRVRAESSLRAESRPQSKDSERSDLPVAVASGLARGWGLSAAASDSGSELREPRAGRERASPWSRCSREPFAGAGMTGARPRPPIRSSQSPILRCRIRSPAGGFRTARSLTLNRGKQAQRPEEMIEVTLRQRQARTEGRWGAGTTGWSRDPVGASGEDSTRSLTLCESTVMETQLSPLLGSDFDFPGLFVEDGCQGLLGLEASGLQKGPPPVGEQREAGREEEKVQFVAQIWQGSQSRHQSASVQVEGPSAVVWASLGLQWECWGSWGGRD